MAKLYEFIKITDKPTLTTEYIGELKTNAVKHTKEHTFNLENKEQREVLIDIVKKYGLTKGEFSNDDIKNHPFFYKILSNNIRKDTSLVYYYYNKELEYLDALNIGETDGSYKNGILLYGFDDIMSVNRVYKLTEKVEEQDKGFKKETLEDFRDFFLSKRSGHDFKKDLEEILNAEDNANEYETVSRGRYFNKKFNKTIEGNIHHTAKAPKIEFILNKTNLNEEAKNKFRNYEDLKDFVENFEEDKFDRNELKEFFNAVDKIDNEYALHFELMDKVEEIKEKL